MTTVLVSNTLHMQDLSMLANFFNNILYSLLMFTA